MHFIASQTAVSSLKLVNSSFAVKPKLLCKLQQRSWIMQHLSRMLLFARSVLPSSSTHHPKSKVCKSVNRLFATVPQTPAQMTTMSVETKQTIPTHDVVGALNCVRDRISAASSTQNGRHVQLVAVSKTKPAELLQAAYDAGQRHFGENYVQELVQKAPLLPGDMKWHFIGSLQSNKAKVLLSVPNLYLVESVDRKKTASALQKAAVKANRKEKLKVMVQVNTSGEESKSGCQPGEAAQLAEFVVNECAHLELVGLMTIGAFDTCDEPEAFKVLSNERDAVATRLKRPVGELQLSMGMSGDFEAAIRMGSDSVRIGSTIFGAREYGTKS